MNAVRIDNYQIEDFIAVGGTSIVFKAYDADLFERTGEREEYALKVLRDPQKAIQEYKVSRQANSSTRAVCRPITVFEVSAEVLAPLLKAHPIDWDGALTPHSQLGVIVFELLYAVPLIEGTATDRELQDGEWAVYQEDRRVVQRVRPDLNLSFENRLTLVKQLAKIIAQFHQMGVTHLDLGPANVFYDTFTEELVVFDFGSNTERRATPGWASREFLEDKTLTDRTDRETLGLWIARLLHDHPEYRDLGQKIYTGADGADAVWIYEELLATEKKSKTKANRYRYGLVAVLFFFFGGLWAVKRQEPFRLVSDDNLTLAVLACDADRVLPDMIEKTLSTGLGIKKIEEPVVPCQMTLEELDYTALYHRVDFLLWGSMAHGRSGVSWRGEVFYQGNRSIREIEVTAANQITLVDAIGEVCMELMDQNQELAPAESFYSENPRVNLLFSEGLLFLRQGSVSTARDLFHTALKHDPNFYLAAIHWAEAAGHTGQASEAIATLEELLAQLLPGPVEHQARTQLVKLYYQNYRLNEADALILETLKIIPNDDPSSLSLLEIKSKILSLRGRHEDAKRVTQWILDFANAIGPKAQLSMKDALYRTHLEQRDYPAALQEIEQALEVTRQNRLGSKQAEFTFKKANLLMRMKDAELIEAFIPELVETGNTALTNGRSNHRMVAEYWLAKLKLVLGQTQEAKDLFNLVAEEALHHGNIDMEIRSHIAYYDLCLKDNQPAARHVLNTLLKRVHALPTSKQILIHSRNAHFLYLEGDLEGSLAALETVQAIVKPLGDLKNQTRVLANKGEVLLQMNRLSEAEEVLLQSLALKKEAGHSLVGVSESLVRLYTLLNDDEKRAHYQNLVEVQK